MDNQINKLIIPGAKEAIDKMRQELTNEFGYENIKNKNFLDKNIHCTKRK